ncbi:MAG: hypothetical protein RI919_822 [Actinomycetota bacterium]|jgi:hypothetical protein
MFKPLPADPELLQQLRVRNRIASLASFGVLIGFPIFRSFGLLPELIEINGQFYGLAFWLQIIVSSITIPASVFFFGHEQRYKNLLAYLATNPAVYPATVPAPSDLQKLQGKKLAAIVWHSITIGAPLLLALLAFAYDGNLAFLPWLFVGGLITFVVVTVGLVMSVISINGYLSFKARLRWAFPDAEVFRDYPKNA